MQKLSVSSQVRWCSGLCTGRPVPAQGYRIGRVEATTGRCDARSPTLFFYGFSAVFPLLCGQVKRLRGGDYSPPLKRVRFKILYSRAAARRA